MADERFVDADVLIRNINAIYPNNSSGSGYSDLDRALDSRVNQLIVNSLSIFKSQLIQAIEMSATASPCMLCKVRSHDRLPDQ